MRRKNEEGKRAMQVSPIKASMIKPAETVRLVKYAAPAEGTVLDDVLDPAYWVHVAADLQPGTKIEVCPLGFKWYAELLVVRVIGTRVEIKLLSSVDLDVAEQKPSASEFATRWGGPQKYQVVDADRNVVAYGFDTETAALQHIASMAPRAA